MDHLHNTPDNAMDGPQAPILADLFSRLGDKELRIELFRSNSNHPRAPIFSGTIGAVPVSAFLRSGANGPFLGLVGERISETRYKNLGTANIITSPTGYPRLVVRMDGRRIFGSVRRTLDDEMLVRMGLDLNIQNQKRTIAANQSNLLAKDELPN